MLQIGVHTRNVVEDACPEKGFAALKRAGFSCADFSLNTYQVNKELYHGKTGGFFERSVGELEDYFAPHRAAAQKAQIRIHQMHMPYPGYIPSVSDQTNDYLRNQMAPKSLKLCAFFGCRYLVVHGFKLAGELGSEAAEWELTKRWLDGLAPLAKELGITMCLENLYTGREHLVTGPCCDAKKAAERIDRMNDKYHAEVLGFCFDTGHANLVGLDFPSFLATLGERVKVLHIHDNDGIADLHQLPFTFATSGKVTACVDWDGFICGLKKIRFDGVLNFETGPVLTAFPASMQDTVLRFIAQTGEYFARELEGEE